MKATFAILKRLLASQPAQFSPHGDCDGLRHLLRRRRFEQRELHVAARRPDPLLLRVLRLCKAHAPGREQEGFLPRRLISYGVLALGISLVNTLIHLVIDPLYPAQTVINLMDVCRWTENGIFAAALQQMFFLLLVMVFLHVLLSMQTHWYGWLTDVVLVAIVCVFTPIAPLRAILAGFFQVLMRNGNAVLHIGSAWR